MKIWTNFYSYFSVTYNLMAESVGETRLLGPKRLPIMAADFLMLFVVPAVLQVYIYALLRGDDKEPEELAAEALHAAIMSPFMAMVGVRDLATALSGDQRAASPAGIVLKRFIDLSNQVQQGDADEAFYKSLNQAAGVVFHYPAAQVQRTALGVQALANGDTQNPMALLLGPPQKPKN